MTEIRLARMDDIPAIAEIISQAWHLAYGHFMDPRVMEDWANPVNRAVRMKRRWREETLRWVAVDRVGQVIGVTIDQSPASLPCFDAEIGAFYVHPSASGQGVGTALFGHAVNHYTTLGAKTLGIHTLAQNIIGRGFYKKMGGTLHSETEWNGIPSVWYIWSLGEPVPAQ